MSLVNRMLTALLLASVLFNLAAFTKGKVDLKRQENRHKREMKHVILKQDEAFKREQTAKVDAHSAHAALGELHKRLTLIPPSPRECESERGKIQELSKLLAQCSRRYTELGETADEIYNRGLTCELWTTSY